MKTPDIDIAVILPKKNIALIAHDRCKKSLLEWVRDHQTLLVNHNLYATRSTGLLIIKETGLKVSCFKSGPIGGDIQIGSRIIYRKIDMLIFFWDPLEPQPHDPDIKALLRLAVLYDIPTANNRASADFIISSSLMNEQYKRVKNTNIR